MDVIAIPQGSGKTFENHDATAFTPYIAISPRIEGFAAAV